MASDHFDESDYNPETIEFVQWREKIQSTAKAVGKEIGFEDVVINVFGTWGYRDRIGTVRLYLNGCESVQYWNDDTVKKFHSEEDAEMLLRQLLPQMLQLVAEETKQKAAKIALEKERERIEAEIDAKKEAELKAKAAQQMEQYKALTPEQIKADWAAKVAAAKAAQAAQEKEKKRHIGELRKAGKPIPKHLR